MAALAIWLRRWQPIAIHGAILARARPEAVAGAIGDTAEVTFGRWREWVLAQRNQALVEHVTALAKARNATPGQVALAWLLTQHPQIVPIPGTRRRERLEENAAATQVALSADDVADLNAAATRIGVQGNRYNDLHIGLVDR